MADFSPPPLGTDAVPFTFVLSSAFLNSANSCRRIIIMRFDSSLIALLAPSQLPPTTSGTEMQKRRFRVGEQSSQLAVWFALPQAVPQSCGRDTGGNLRTTYSNGYTLGSTGCLRPRPEVLGVTNTSQGYGKRHRNLSPAFSAASLARNRFGPRISLLSLKTVTLYMVQIGCSITLLGQRLVVLCCGQTLNENGLGRPKSIQRD